MSGLNYVDGDEGSLVVNAPVYGCGKQWTAQDDLDFIRLHPIVGNKWRDLSQLMNRK